MIAFLLDTKAGHCLLGLLCVVIAAAGFYWRGHNAGFDAARKADQAQGAQWAAVNATNAATIQQLQAANDLWASVAKANSAQLAQAAEQIALAKAANAKALADAHRKLTKAIQDDHDAHTWAAGLVPDSVLDALGVRGPDSAH